MSAVQQAIAGIGGGVAPTYATWNPADKDASITLSGGNLTAVGSSTGSVRGTLGKATGKWYWEALCNSAGTMGVGVVQLADSLATLPGYTANGWGYFYSGQEINNSLLLNLASTYTSGDVIGVALDAGASTVKWYKNNVLQDTQTLSAGTYYPICGWNANYTANFGASAMIYSPPSGYNAGLY